MSTRLKRRWAARRFSREQCKREAVRLFAGARLPETQTVDIGDRVKRGQVVATVDVPELEKQVQRYGAVVEPNRSKCA